MGNRVKWCADGLREVCAMATHYRQLTKFSHRVARESCRLNPRQVPSPGSSISAFSSRGAPCRLLLGYLLSSSLLLEQAGYGCVTGKDERERERERETETETETETDRQTDRDRDRERE